MAKRWAGNLECNRLEAHGDGHRGELLNPARGRRETAESVRRRTRWPVRCGWHGVAAGEEAWREPSWRGHVYEARGSHEGPGEDLSEGNRCTRRYVNWDLWEEGVCGGRKTRKAR